MLEVELDPSPIPWRRGCDVTVSGHPGSICNWREKSEKRAKPGQARPGQAMPAAGGKFVATLL